MRNLKLQLEDFFSNEKEESYFPLKSPGEATDAMIDLLHSPVSTGGEPIRYLCVPAREGLESARIDLIRAFEYRDQRSQRIQGIFFGSEGLFDVRSGLVKPSYSKKHFFSYFAENLINKILGRPSTKPKKWKCSKFYLLPEDEETQKYPGRYLILGQCGVIANYSKGGEFKEAWAVNKPESVKIFRACFDQLYRQLIQAPIANANRK